MLKFLKYALAKFLLQRMANSLNPPEITQKQADRWNHLQGLVLTKGRIKWNWRKII